MRWAALLLLAVVVHSYLLSQAQAGYVAVEPVLRLWGEVASISDGPGLKLAVVTSLWIAALAHARLVATRASAGPPGRVLLVAAGVAVPLLLGTRLLSADLHSYVAYARMAYAHGANPHLVPPADFASDPMIARADWQSVASVYGPAWTTLSYAIAAVVEWGGATMREYDVAFRVLALSVHLINTALIAAIARHMRPREAGWIATAFATCPLLLVEVVGQAHNEGVVIACLLAGVLLHLRGRIAWASGAMTIAALVKLTAAPITGLYFVLAVRDVREDEALRRRVGRIVMGSVITAGLAAAPWLDDPRVLLSPLSGPGSEHLHNSTAQAVGNLIAAVRPGPEGADFVARVAPVLRACAFSGFAALWVALAWRTRRDDDFVRSTAWLVVAWCCVGATWFWPWYVTLAVPFALLTADDAARRTVLVLAATVFVLYAGDWIFPAAGRGLDFVWTWYRAAVYFGPPLAVALWHLRLARSPKPPRLAASP